MTNFEKLHVAGLLHGDHKFTPEEIAFINTKLSQAEVDQAVANKDQLLAGKGGDSPAPGVVF